MRALKISYLLCVIFLLTQKVYAQKQRIETINGTKYIIHKVQPKETVYSISKLYNVGQDDLVGLNPSISSVLKSGLEITVPYNQEDKLYPKLQQSQDAASQVKHTVQKGEWLTKIANTYGVSVNELKKWNDLEGEGIKPGQELIVGLGTSKTKNKNNVSKGTAAYTKKTVNKKTTKTTNLKSSPYKIITHVVAKGESLSAIKKKYDVSIADIKEWNDLTSDALNIGQKLSIQASPDINNTGTTTTPVETPLKKEEKVPQYKKTTTTPDENADPFEQLNNNTGNTSSTETSTPVLKNEKAYVYALSQPLNYVVKDGETIYELQNRYNIRKTEIRFWNGMKPDENNLVAGKAIKLYVPTKLTHTITPGETITGVAKLYTAALPVEEGYAGILKRQIEVWNNIPRNQGDAQIRQGKYSTLNLYLPTGPVPPKTFSVSTSVKKEEKTPIVTQKIQPKSLTQTNTNTKVNNANTPIVHVVDNNQYLYDIAQIYGVTIRDLKEWNNLTSYNLTPGQKLNIYRNKQTASKQNISAKNTVTTTQKMRGAQPKNTSTTAAIKTSQEVLKNPYEGVDYSTTSTSDDPLDQLNNAVITSKKKEPKKEKTLYRGSNPKVEKKEEKITSRPVVQAATIKNIYNGNNVVEKGLVQQVQGISSPKPFAALHRNAPIGTLIIVKNLLNNKNTVVEVAAPMNEEQADSNVILEITPQAYQRLGITGNNPAQVEISYMLKK